MLEILEAFNTQISWRENFKSMGQSAGGIKMGFNRKVLDVEKFISKERLEDLYLNQKLPDSKIGEMYGITIGKVHRLRNRYGIKAIEYYQRHHKQEMDEKEKSFVIGVLLGDGHIRLRKEKNNLGRAYPQLMLEQSVKHREYAFWLRDEISDWLSDSTKPLRQARKVDKRTKKVYHSYPFQTICHPVFKEFYDGFYSGRKKVLNIDLVAKYFNEYAFAIWIMDDGTRSKRGRRIQLCSHNFTQEENKILLTFLGNKYGVSGHVRKTVRDGNILYNIDFSVNSSKFASHILRDLIIPSFQYKLVPSSETTKGTTEK